MTWRIFVGLGMILLMSGCQLSLGAATGIGGGVNVGTNVVLDAETGDVDSNLGATIRIP